MAKKIVNLSLPEFAFVDGSGHESKDILKDRIVILHIRSASLIEIFDCEDVFFTEGTLVYNFSYTNSLGIKEPMVAALHFSVTLNRDADQELIKKEIMKPAAKWYCDYCIWEDKNIFK